MRQGGRQIDPRLGRVLAEIHNRFNEVVIGGDDEVSELLLGISRTAEQASLTDNEAELRPLLLDIATGSLALILSVDRRAEVEFHRQRRMFYIIGDLITVGVTGDERGHTEWMRDEGDADSFGEAIRGYVDSTGIYAYKGHDFSLPPAAEADFAGAFPALVEQMNLDADLEVYAGVLVGPVGQRWLPRKKLGKVRELMGW